MAGGDEIHSDKRSSIVSVLGRARSQSHIQPVDKALSELHGRIEHAGK